MEANIEYINPFIEASQNILKDLCNIETKIGKPYLRGPLYEGDNLIVIVGLTGQVRGQVVLNMNIDVACKLASHMMMGMEVVELNDMAKSAIGELVNMILGNTATIFSNKGIIVDITPPSVCTGNNLSISVDKTKTICIPFSFDENKKIELNILINC